MLDAGALMQVATRPGFESLKYADWPAQWPCELPAEGELWPVLQEQDVLLFHPYESFDPVVQLLCSRRPTIPTCWRSSRPSIAPAATARLVKALSRAAEAGKQVTVLVELKARFDEAKNVQWARQLEDAGCYVIYGIAGYKTHAKALLIVRRGGPPGAPLPDTPFDG